MSETYKKIPHRFTNGELLTNNNGYEYKVLDATTQSEVLFERVKDGEKVRAQNPKLFEKSNNGVISVVLEWQSGKYFR